MLWKSARSFSPRHKIAGKPLKKKYRSDSVPPFVSATKQTGRGFFYEKSYPHYPQIFCVSLPEKPLYSPVCPHFYPMIKFHILKSSPVIFLLFPKISEYIHLSTKLSTLSTKIFFSFMRQLSLCYPQNCPHFPSDSELYFFRTIWYT